MVISNRGDQLFLSKITDTEINFKIEENTTLPLLSVISKNHLDLSKKLNYQ